MEALLSDCEAPGLSLAVSRAENLLFATTFGLDQLRPPRLPLHTRRLFRLGQISQVSALP